MICWVCRKAVSPEADLLMLRHFATESNILNFLRDNSDAGSVPALRLYPQKIDDMLEDTFVRHDQELFRVLRDIGGWDDTRWPRPAGELSGTDWRPMTVELQSVRGGAPELLEFED